MEDMCFLSIAVCLLKVSFQSKKRQRRENLSPSWSRFMVHSRVANPFSVKMQTFQMQSKMNNLTVSMYSGMKRRGYGPCMSQKARQLGTNVLTATLISFRSVMKSDFDWKLKTSTGSSNRLLRLNQGLNLVLTTPGNKRRHASASFGSVLIPLHAKSQ